MLEQANALQDKGIRKEFIRQQDYTEKNFADVRNRLSLISNQFSQQEKRIDHRVGQLGERIDHVGARFDHVGDRVDRVEGELYNLSAILRNAQSARLRDRIYPLGRFDTSSSTFVLPPRDFPQTVAAFLKAMKSEKFGKMFRFYGLTSYKNWNDAADEDLELITIPEDHDTVNSNEFEGLEEAIERYPTLAFQDLGRHWGLPVDDIQRKIDEYQNTTRTVTKRARAEEPKTPIGVGQDAEKSKMTTQMLDPNVLFRVPGSHPTSPSDSRSILTYAEWDTSRSPKSKKVVTGRIRDLGAAYPASPSTSKGSRRISGDTAKTKHTSNKGTVPFSSSSSPSSPSSSSPSP